MKPPNCGLALGRSSVHMDVQSPIQRLRLARADPSAPYFPFPLAPVICLMNSASSGR